MKCLFLGGSRDGDIIDVDPSVEAFNFTTKGNRIITNRRPSIIIKEQYVRKEYCEGYNAFFFYVCDDIKHLSVLGRLIDHYRANPDPV